MRIGINGFEAVVPRFGFDSNGLPNRVGSSEVCFQLLCELEKLDKQNEYIVYLPVKPTEDLPGERDGWKYKIVPHKKLWTIFALGPAARKDNLDVFFNPTHYGPFFLNCPQVITVLDVSYKRFPEMFKKKDLLQLNMWGRRSIKSAARIITISRASRDDIIKIYKVPEAKIKVVYLGIKKATRQQANQNKMDKPYILFVGTLQPRKNIVALIEAFSKLDNQDLELIIIGRRGWNYEEILDAPKKYKIDDRVRFLENVSDEELPNYYKQAQLFVLPSLYEGFGLPVLEAMRYGCPVATSNVSSLPEAGGDAAIYFDPKDVNDIAEKIEKVLSSETLRNDMIEKGFEQVKKFSWEKSAKQVLEVLEEINELKS